MWSELTILIGYGICMGIAATLTMDVLGSLSQRIGLIAGAKGIWIGRWYLGIAQGQFYHSDIATSPEQPGEKRAALIGHYIIGIILAVFYVVGGSLLSISPSLFLVATAYGLATCVFPWLLVFPALGFGLFGLRGQPELRLFTSSLMNHFFYGLGLWATATMLQFS